MPKVKKQKYYAIYSKNDNFLHGVFPLSEEGKLKAKEYLKKISDKNNSFYIKKS
jgi:hypothetical protein